jgi:hypothetical protein
MLRRVVLFATLAVALVGLWQLSRHQWTPGLQILGFAALVFVIFAFENWRYRSGPAPRGARWQSTGEKFADPVTGEEVEVEYDPASGKRRYLHR